ncbi:D-alanyl-lipoteichoic acid biosynthesis protein DltD [Clostridiaceae bacterium UIB06]|uniref:Protein DltD n=1 Tax=Clostridium thailandense TaxID=2794346 RepID=A0A949X3E9_9CLOT|nr:D-alanyl-lipoteichoic acid biosynthesis protein DltD [Clostridium thailandense]MBV7274444.1 D-alanyl-lipoteichoic acid biosynthesis protein DltD [Clostridium thailandense]MCH5136630.1 D-alanyl-lipoteichoic acid biosynthesis protein DltD [Clostridiaceae bacterium UIB06]
MKKIAIILTVFAAFAILTLSSLYLIDNYYTTKINSIYYDKFGNELLSEKEKGLILQKKSLERKDNLQLIGSSELADRTIPTHPINIFADKADGFQVNGIGRGYCQSIIHAARIGALSKEFKDKKLVIIISPQWFNAKGLGTNEFLMNFSELQFYTFMFNKDINKSIKLSYAKRVKSLLGGDKNNLMVSLYANLYTYDNIPSKFTLGMLTPYYKFKSYIVGIRDKRIAYDRLVKYKKAGEKQYIEPKTSVYDWSSEMEKANSLAKTKTTNNDFYISNDYYNEYIKDNLDKYIGSYKNESYTNSPEYEDFKLLLEICKSQNIKPLFVSVPVNGRWYDYCQFPKENRETCYKKIKNLVQGYGFEILDLSGHEYEKYFLKDIMHLGWKGWIYIDEAIDKYYHENK